MDYIYGKLNFEATSIKTIDARNVLFDNEYSELVSKDVQGAIHELENWMTESYHDEGGIELLPQSIIVPYPDKPFILTVLDGSDNCFSITSSMSMLKAVYDYDGLGISIMGEGQIKLCTLVWEELNSFQIRTPLSELSVYHYFLEQ